MIFERSLRSHVWGVESHIYKWGWLILEYVPVTNSDNLAGYMSMQSLRDH